ncbi:MAG: hypothetical protein ACFE9L_11250 [Candidatus Hodarchaeota archaeon]
MKISLSFLIIVNLTIITWLFLIICISPSLVSSTSEINMKNKGIMTNFSDSIILSHGIPQIGIFNATSISHKYTFKAIKLGQLVYFSINPDLDCNITLFNPFHEESDIERTIHSDEDIYLGSWKASLTGDWLLEVNNSRDENLTYEILASIPKAGYSDDSAIFLNESDIIANFTIDHEVHYWKVSLEENQNCSVFLKELMPDVLSEGEVTIYSMESGKENPIPVEEKHSEALGLYNYSWNAFAKDEYIIKISHKTVYTGLYNISFSKQQDLYNFLEAGRLPHNQTISVCEVHSYASQKKYYFWFMVNSSRSEVNISVYEENPTLNKILDYATIEIYDKGLQDPIRTAQEYRSTQDGEINISIHLNEGKYYLVIIPKSETKGVFYIHFQYQPPRPFTLELTSIFVSICILMILPAYLIYLDSKGKWYRIDQWNIPTSLQESYKLFKNSFSGIFNIKEVPNESILIRVASIPFRTYSLLNFVESSEIETIVFSKRINRRIEWAIYFLVGFFCFDFVNILFYVFFSNHFLPFDILNLTNLLLVLAIPTVLLVIIVLFINVSSYITYRQIVSRISYVVQNYKESSDEEISFKGIDSIQANKNINYVRVLWNQAKHAFKEKNYELFVIKADASVKNLLSTRFLQIVSDNTQSKPDFQIQVTELRKRGFDLPSDKKIAHFRNLRNRIVHSSVTLDEKESVNCFAYYSTFITRLGLRPS